MPPPTSLLLTLFSSLLLLNPLSTTEYSYSADKVSIQRHMTQNETFRFDLSSHIDLNSISSNFSTNNPHLVLPGVKGRQTPPKKYFEQKILNPIRTRAKYGHLTFLDQDGEHFVDFVVTDEKDIRERTSALTLRASEEGLNCHHSANKDKWFFFVCSRGSFPDLEFRIIALDILLNEIGLEVTIQSFNFRKPSITMFLKDSMLKNQYTLLISEDYNQNVQDELPVFEPETQIVLVRLFLGDLKESRELVAQRMINLPKLNFCLPPDIQEQDEPCNVQLRKVSFVSTSSVFITANVKTESNQFPKHRVFMCDFQAGLNLEELQFHDCRLHLESSLLHFRAYKRNYAYIDTNQRLFFCMQSVDFSSARCKSGALKEEWKVKHFKLAESTALILVEAEATDIIFVNYFGKDIFTWFFVKPDRSRFIDVVRLGGYDKFYLLRVPLNKGGFSLRNLQFTPKLELGAQDLQQLETTILYQENLPLLEIKLKLWDGRTVIDLFRNITEAVVYDRKTRVFAKRLGFQGANLDFQDTALQKVYYFSATRLHLPLLPLTDEDWANEDRFPPGNQGRQDYDPPKMLFMSTMRRDIIYLFQDRAVISVFSIAERALIVTETDQVEVVFQKNLRLDLDKVVTHHSFGDEIIVLSRDPVHLIAIDRSTLIVSEYTLPSVFSETLISDCSISDWFLVCTQTESQGQVELPIVFVFDTDSHSVEIESLMTRVLRYRLNEFTIETVDGRPPNSYEILSLDVDPIVEGDFTLVIKLHYGGIFQTRGFQVSFARVNQPNRTWDQKHFRPLDFLTRPGLIKNETILYSFDHKFLVLETSPKYALTLVDSLGEIPMSYLDTNDVLASFMSRTFRLLVLVYRSLEDGSVYFAVYRLTPNCLKQFVRNQPLPSYTPTLRLDFMNHSPSVISLIFYDSAQPTALLAYTLFYNGPILLGKSHENVLINDTRYPLHLYEDKTMHANRFLSKRPLLFDIEDSQTILEVSLPTYFEVQGHVDYLSFDAPANSAIRQHLTILEGIQPKHTDELLVIKPTPLTVPPTQFVENKSLFAVNPNAPGHFSIFSKSSRQIVQRVTIELCEYCRCLKLALGNSSLFCFHSQLNQSRVAIIDFKDPDAEKISMSAPPLGLSYQLLSDNSMFTTFLVLHHTSTALELLRFDKNRRSFSRLFLTAEDFGVVNLLISDFHVHYQSSKGVITILLLNSMSLSLHVYSAYFLPQDMSLTKAKTLNDRFSLKAFNTSIFGLKCNHQLSGFFQIILNTFYTFNC